MKKILFILLICPLIGYGQIVDRSVAKIAKKNIEIFLTPSYESDEPIIIVAKKGDRRISDKDDGIADYMTNALIRYGKEVIKDGKGNTLEFTIRWDAFNELKKLSATIYNYESKVVGTITYNGPYIPNNHMDIASAVAYKLINDN